MIARRLMLLTLVAVSAMVGCLVFVGLAAQAAVTHDYLSQITEVPTGPGVGIPGPVTELDSMTVDSGDLWVAEHVSGTSNYRIDEFNDSTGAFIAQLPQVPDIEEFSRGVAVGHTTGEPVVYVGGVERVAGEPEGVVAVFNKSGFQAAWTGTPAGSFGSRGVHDVAVDNSTSLTDWAAGDVLVATGAAVDVFRPRAGGSEEYVTQITGVSPSEPFSDAERVAVDEANGDVLIVNEGAVDVFAPSALAGEYEFLRTITGPPPTGTFGGIRNLATDGSDGDVYVAEENIVDEFSLEGAYLGRITGADTPAGGFKTLFSVAVDPLTGDVFVGDYREEEGGVIDVFGAGIVIPDVTTGSVSGLTATGAILNGTVNPDKAGGGSCEFVWGTSTGFGEVTPCTALVGEGEAAVAAQASLSELQPDTTYYYRLQATNANGTNPGEGSQDRQFTTPGPGLNGESAADITSTSATLDATLDPDGATTSYYFEYGTSNGYGSEVPVLSGATPYGEAIGSGEGNTEVSQHVQGLLPATIYHYRVVAVSELTGGRQTFYGVDQTFTTQTTGGELTLPDGRQWEMVTPPQKEGADFEPIGESGVIQASVNGDAIADLAHSPTEAKPAGYALSVSVLSTRGVGGWSSQTIAPPHVEATGLGIGNGDEYRFFSEDLALGVVQPFGGFLALSPEASESTAYLHSDYLDGEVSDHCESSYQSASSCFQPLVSAANVPAGTHFGETEEDECDHIRCGPQFVGASPDAEHVVLSSPAQLTETSTEGQNALYEWNAGSLALVSILPAGEINEAGGSVAYEVVLGQDQAARHAISNDGSHIVWEGRTGRTETLHLYLRDTTQGETVRLDLPEGGSGTGSSAPGYMTASADGSRIFFTDEAGLIGESSPGGRDLYEYDLNAPAGSRLRDLSVDTHAGEAADVASVIGASEEGSYVYFTAAGALARGAAAGECGGNSHSSGDTSACNLYVSHDGTTALVAALSQEDFPDWSGGGEALGKLTARVSPDGGWLAFMSQRSLTGYDTSDAVSGRPDEEVYLYDAEAQREGRPSLVCASCNPTGARPVGVEYEKVNGALVGGDRVWDGTSGIAANIPGWTPFSLGESRYQSRYLSDSGRLFFNSIDALAPQDVNGAEDVYEYEPPGVGSCAQSAETFSERSGGCVGLISSGSSSEESAFLDASETGGDVFFLTKAKLVSEDFDTSLDVYDAHECTPQTPCFPVASVAPSACETGEACKPAPTPQPAIFGVPASGTFSGSGNVVVQSGVKVVVGSKSLTRAQKLTRALSACRKSKRRKQRAVCERTARSKYGMKKSVKANAKKGRR
ncbi:MAG TPA: hypothetical protein VIJ39_15145 [Solirubrobacteraceae bacterium]